MLQPNFQSSLLKKSLTTSQHVHNPKIRVQYSGGFRKFEPAATRQSKHNELQQTLSKTRYTQKQQQILKYVDQLGIQNLKNYYQDTISDTSKLLYQKFKQEQTQSVVRLYKNLYPSRRSKMPEPDNKQQRDKQSKKVASQVWSIDSKFENEPPEFILRNQIQKIHRKYLVELRGILKKKKIFQNFLCYCQYPLVLSCFFIEHAQSILKVKKSVKMDEQMEIFYLWKGFLSTANFKYLSKTYENKLMHAQKLQKLKYFSKYLYCMINPQISKTASQINFKTLVSLINIQPLIPTIQQLKAQFQITKQYTNPYLIQYQNLASKNINLHSQRNEEQSFKFKAAPIPNSTYTHKQIKKTESKTTKIEPFNITEKGNILTPQQFYQKQQTYKAYPVPQTIRKPFKPSLLTKQQIKAKALMNLQKASYPKTMKQLNDYQQYQKSRNQQLIKRHVKNYHQSYHPHQIPNFDHLHAQQIIGLQNRKQKNKKNIEVKPFNLSTGKPKKTVQQNNFIHAPTNHKYVPPKHQKPSKSTKKFDAYIKYRNEKERKRVQMKQNEQKQREKKQQKKKPYVELIKQRMRQEFAAHPKPKSNYDSGLPQRIKVDKQKIYSQAPLLMKSSLPPQQIELEWNPIF